MDGWMDECVCVCEKEIYRYRVNERETGKDIERVSEREKKKRKDGGFC